MLSEVRYSFNTLINNLFYYLLTYIKIGSVLGSYAYESSKGAVLSESPQIDEEHILEPYVAGDVVGCILTFSKDQDHSISFTKNGKLLRFANEEENVRVLSTVFNQKFTPIIGLRGKDTSVFVNFGQKPFVFDTSELYNENLNFDPMTDRQEAITYNTDDNNDEDEEDDEGENDLSPQFLHNMAEHDFNEDDLDDLEDDDGDDEDDDDDDDVIDMDNMDGEYPPFNLNDGVDTLADFLNLSDGELGSYDSNSEDEPNEHSTNDSHYITVTSKEKIVGVDIHEIQLLDSNSLEAIIRMKIGDVVLIHRMEEGVGYYKRVGIVRQIDYIEQIVLIYLRRHDLGRDQQLWIRFSDLSILKEGKNDFTVDKGNCVYLNIFENLI